MSATQLINSPFIFRPTYTREDLSIETRRERNERRYVPSVLIPHTIEITEKDGHCSMAFEYTIDEVSDKDISIDTDIILTRGKYTNKVLNLKFFSESREDVAVRLTSVREALLRQLLTNKRTSVMRNYELVADSLNPISSILLKDPEFMKSR